MLPKTVASMEGDSHRSDGFNICEALETVAILSSSTGGRTVGVGTWRMSCRVVDEVQDGMWDDKTIPICVGINKVENEMHY